MRRISKYLGPAVGFVVGFFPFLNYVAPKDWIATMQSYASDVGIPLPSWFNQSHERQIVRGGFELALCVISLLLLWPLLTELLACLHRNLILVTSVQQMTKRIPQKMVPADQQQWGATADRANRRLRKFVNRPARIAIVVEEIQVTPNGRYQGITQIRARTNPDPATRLPVMLKTYFDGADAELLHRVRAHAPQDPIEVTGMLTRADVALLKNVGGFHLNIDLRYCSLDGQ